MSDEINQPAIEALRQLLQHQPSLVDATKVDASCGEDLAEFYFGFLRKFTELSQSHSRAPEPSPSPRPRARIRR